jgi:hypothetical protein
MRIVRVTLKLIRLVAIVYTLWRAYRGGKKFILITGLWRLLRGRPVLGVPKPDLIVVDSTDPRIYKRRGWRKYPFRAIKKL